LIGQGRGVLAKVVILFHGVAAPRLNTWKIAV
jgi:hypothetical protein